MEKFFLEQLSIIDNNGPRGTRYLLRVEQEPPFETINVEFDGVETMKDESSDALMAKGVPPKLIEYIRNQ